MQLPTGKTLGKALEAWRLAKNLRPTDIVKNSIKNNKKTVPDSNVSSIENDGKGFSYDHLIEDVFPAYGIKDICDFDLFLDYCVNHSVKTISVIRNAERDTLNTEDTREILIPPERLKGNRTRISIIEIKVGKRTKWQNHEGHEFVLVGKGQVIAEFADTIDTGIDKRTHEKLSEGDGVAFCSAIYHSFINDGSEIAQLIIARPAKSLPKGMQYRGYD